MQFLFSDCVLDPERRELTRAAKAVSVGPQVFDLLLYLVQNRDRVVSKDHMIEAVWGGRIVSESTFTSHINAVRVEPDHKLELPSTEELTNRGLSEGCVDAGGGRERERGEAACGSRRGGDERSVKCVAVSGDLKGKGHATIPTLAPICSDPSRLRSPIT